MNPDFMKKAIILAQKAMQKNEVPVGAVIVYKDQIIGEGFNQKETNLLPFHHAEILAIQEACLFLKNYRLIDCDIYVTLEPCLMCAGAIISARLKNCYFGTSDPKGGAFGSLYDFSQDLRLNHRVNIQSGIEKENCQELLKIFFKQLRQSKKDLEK